MLKIWGRAGSSNVMKVLWVCEELGIPHQRVDAGGAFGVTQEAAYLAMNPNAKVPTIEEPDGFSLFESNSICRYLVATRAPGHAMYPADPKARARVERWMDWQLGHLGPPMTTLFLGLIRTPEEKRDLKAIAAARDEAEWLWGMVDSAVAGSDFVTGPASTLADVVLGPQIHRWLSLPIARRPMPQLEAWYGRLRRRPGYMRHMAVPLS
jgi:glutathione S-transferase